LCAVVVVGFERHEISCRIAGNLAGQLNFPNLADAVGRERNYDIGKIQRRSTKTGKHFRRRGPHACRRDQHFDLARAGGAGRNRLEKAFWGSTTGEAANRYGNDKKSGAEAGANPERGPPGDPESLFATAKR